MAKLYIRFHDFKIQWIHGVVLVDVKVESDHPSVTLIYPVALFEDHEANEHNDELCNALSDMIAKSSSPQFPYTSTFEEMYALAKNGKLASTANVSVWTDGADAPASKRQRLRH